MEIQKTPIPGCYEIHPKIFRDDRGSFVKTFHQEVFTSHGLNTTFAEEYYSVSHKNVLRGMHFQLPPMDHTKLVYCVLGKVLDVVVDLRVGSPTYGKCQQFELSADKANLVYIPPGLAHGFYVTSEIAIMMYKVSTVYAPDLDAGIRWDSIAFSWSNENPIISQRDQNFQSFAEFNSPFQYSPDENDHE
ncbi:MAG: dTDP-4-dehydrorhamnose 3,5-epimerase [Elainellaceae cyanobacterium]